jgi:hypothetical protein
MSDSRWFVRTISENVVTYKEERSRPARIESTFEDDFIDRETSIAYLGIPEEQFQEMLGRRRIRSKIFQGISGAELRYSLDDLNKLMG